MSAATGAQSIGALSGVAGTNVALGGNALTLGGTASGTFSGAIGGTGSLTLAGTGTQTLNGASTYSGGTNLSGGSNVVLGNNSALGTGTVNVAGAATLDTNTSVSVANAASWQRFDADAGRQQCARVERRHFRRGRSREEWPGDHDADGREHLHGRHDDQRGHAGGGRRRQPGGDGRGEPGAGAALDSGAATSAQTIGALSGVAGRPSTWAATG